MTHEEQWKEVSNKTREQSLTEEQNRELKLYLYMLLWKDTFCKDYNAYFDIREEIKYHITWSGTKEGYIVSHSRFIKRNMQVYLPTYELAEQMLQDLKDVGVIKE